MNLTELWRLSHIVYREVSFQSIFSFRSGAILPQRGRSSIEQLARNAELNTLLSKIITTLFLAIFGFTMFLPSTPGISPGGISKELIIAGGISAYFAVVLFLITFMGLQVATSFFSSRVTEILSPLPLTRLDVSKIVFLCFIRIFDIPLIVAVIVPIVAYIIFVGFFLGVLVVLVGILVTEAFALVLCNGLARFFYSKVAVGGGKSVWRTVLRFVFMLIWVLPTFGIYFVMSFATQVTQSFGSLAQVLSSLQFLAALYPFSFGFLVSFATSYQQIDPSTFGLSIISSVGYFILAVFCLRWVVSSIRSIGTKVAVSFLKETVKDTIIKPKVPWLGIIYKDLRIASRAPSYASLFFLPAIETAVLAVTFSSYSDIGLSVTFGMLVGISIVTLILPPLLLSMESLGSAYTRSLPLKKRTLIFAKTVTVTVTYLVSLLVLFIVTLYFRRDFTFILTFGIIHTFSVAAASMLELTLADVFSKEGIGMGNIYASLSTFALVLIPGILAAMVPITAAFVTYFFASQLSQVVFLVIALSEFVVMTAVVLHQR
jgi:hypothetical protein